MVCYTELSKLGIIIPVDVVVNGGWDVDRGATKWRLWNKTNSALKGINGIN